MKVKFRFGQRVPRSEEYPKKWKKVDVLEIDCSQPVIFSLGGNGTVSDVFANGMAKTVENILDVQSKDNYINIYSIRYGSADDYKNGELDFGECKYIANELFIPLVSKGRKRLDCLTACKNMRNINIFSFCYGASAVGNIFSYVGSRMDDLGYEKNEISEILRQVLHITYEPYGENSYTTNFEIKSFADEAFGNYFKDEYAKATKNSTDYIGAGQLVVNGNNVNCYVSNMAGENKEKKDHDIGWIVANKQGRALPQYLKKPDELLGEIDSDENESLTFEGIENLNYHRADAMAECVAFTMALGVTNSKANNLSSDFVPLPSANEIAELNKSTLLKANSSVKEQKEMEEFNNFQLQK